MKFIRKNGRVIPIRDKGEVSEGTGYKKQAAAGVAIGALSRVSQMASTLGSKVGNAKAMKFGKYGALAAVGGGLVADFSAFKESVKHGKQQHSFTAGAGRYLGLTTTRIIGAGLGSSIVGGTATWKVRRGVAKRAAEAAANAAAYSVKKPKALLR